jgi:FkbM family methyltransferase
MIKSILKKTFSILGYSLHKKKQPRKEQPSMPIEVKRAFNMQGALERCMKRGLNVSTVIDVGASDGRWSRACMKSLPDANYFLVEAQSVHQSGLNQFKEEVEKGDYVLAAAGKSDGKIFFDNENPFGGLASETKLDQNCIEVPVVSIDRELERRNLKGPYLLKLDTHGFEVPILEGAKNTIKDASLVIIETYNYKLTHDSLRFWEMCSYMEKLGFVPIEMVDLMLREYDNSFWQMDTFFIPVDSKEFSYNKYI